MWVHLIRGSVGLASWFLEGSDIFTYFLYKMAVIDQANFVHLGQMLGFFMGWDIFSLQIYMISAKYLSTLLK